jgi:hypothetical protein
LVKQFVLISLNIIHLCWEGHTDHNLGYNREIALYCKACAIDDMEYGELNIVMFITNIYVQEN